MELLLWRHAEAVDGYPDTARALTEKGERQARRVAKWLNPHLPEGVRIVTSPAVRARQTARALGRVVEESPYIAPGATVETHLEAAGWPDAGGTVILVGHQPALGRVAAYLMTRDDAEWGMKKGAVWWFEFRERGRAGEVILKAVVSPDVLD
jgi:phosphohistidine phosphatase